MYLFASIQSQFLAVIAALQVAMSCGRSIGQSIGLSLTYIISSQYSHSFYSLEKDEGAKNIGTAKI